MSDGWAAREFLRSPDAEGWRGVASAVLARFRTADFATGLRFVEAIGESTADGGPCPDVDLRAEAVTVRLSADGPGGLTQRHAELARRISEAARGLGLVPDPGGLQDVQVTVDVFAVPTVRAFWRGVLGYRDKGEDDLVDPDGRGPALWFQGQDEPGRARLHVDVHVAADEAEARVAAALQAGGRLVTDEHAPAWWVLSDPEGNLACVATVLGRD